MEKVSKGLECCKKTDGSDCKNCPYTDEIDCVEFMARDALELLKEQDDKIRQLRLALQIMNGNGIKVDTECR